MSHSLDPITLESLTGPRTTEEPPTLHILFVKDNGALVAFCGEKMKGRLVPKGTTFRRCMRCWRMSGTEPPANKVKP
jgi:hypothetical protein